MSVCCQYRLRSFFFEGLCLIFLVFFVASCKSSSTSEPNLPRDINNSTIEPVDNTVLILEPTNTPVQIKPADHQTGLPPTTASEETPLSDSNIDPTPTEFIMTPPKSEIFSLSTIYRDIPDDVIKEMYTFSAGGALNFSEFCASQSQESFHVFPDEQSLNLNDNVLFVICHWQRENPPIIRVRTPNDDELQLVMFEEPEAFYMDEVSGAFIYVPDIYDTIFLSDPLGVPGIYTFTIDGYEEELAPKQLIFERGYPGILWIEESDKLILFNFSPEEIVRLIIYEPSTRDREYDTHFASGWQEVKVDAEGRLILELKDYNGLRLSGFVAIGDISGVVTTYKQNYADGGIRFNLFTESSYYPFELLKEQEFAEENSNINSTNCPGAFPSRLQIGEKVRILAENLNVREGPGANYSTVYGTSLSKGRTVTILEGPVCSGGMLWWKGESGIITLSNGESHNIIGWMAEESGDEWLLEPLP